MITSVKTMTISLPICIIKIILHKSLRNPWLEIWSQTFLMFPRYAMLRIWSVLRSISIIIITFSYIGTRIKPLQRLTLVKKFIMTITCVITVPHVLHMVLKIGKVGSLVISLKPIFLKNIILSRMRSVAKDLILVIRNSSYLT